MSGRFCLTIKLVFVVIVAASLSQLVMGYQCADRTCLAGETYPCVDPEMGCACRIARAGPQCEKNRINSLECIKRLGVSQHLRYVKDQQLNASSWLNENFTPQHGRLFNPTSAWCAHPSDPDPRYRVTFTDKVTLIGLHMQGDPNQGVNRLKSIDIHVQATIESRFVKIMTKGMSLAGKTKLSFRLSKFQEGVAFEIQVKKFEGDYACMRVELLGCIRNEENPRADADCYEHLGVKDRNIYPDSSFNGTSVKKDNRKFHYARLDGPHAWCPKDLNNEEYLTIKLPREWKYIHGIITQGLYLAPSQNTGFAKYLVVKKNGVTHKSGGDDDIYANYDGVGTTVRFFDQRISMDADSDLIYLIPTKLDGSPGGCLRVELIACDTDEPCHSMPCQHGGTCVRHSISGFRCDCRPRVVGGRCEHVDCNDVIEVRNEDVNVSSSNVVVGNTSFSFRLSDSESWCTTENDLDTWIQLTLRQLHFIGGFSLGGNRNISTTSFVKKFQVFLKKLPWMKWTPVEINQFGNVFNGTMRSGQDRVDYYLDDTDWTYQILFRMEHNNKELKCARVEVRGCIYAAFCEHKGSVVCKNGASCRLEEGKPFVCDCAPGFAGQFCEIDVCKTLNCHSNSTCRTDLPEVTCECKEGFRGNGTFCEDICEVSHCHHNATCGQKTSYKCLCHEDFQGNGTLCEDRCIAANCHEHATCNKDTSYECVCNHGYGGSGSYCHDLCSDCHHNANCSLDDAGKKASCSCNYGFGGNGTHCFDLCEDANCHQNATCNMNDAEKEANCSCNYGFGGNGTHCFDLCEDANCHHNATCNMNDDEKEANCSCNYGFGGNGTHCFDLCEDANCHHNATCNMNDDEKEANCSCNYGFGGNGTHCFDLCEDANCHHNATCNMNDDEKEANCSCNYGFGGNGTHCFDLCEDANCHHNATCNMNDDEKEANCSCNYGFGGNGTHCFDLCEDANCHHNATCNMNDDEKEASCSCNYGFKGDGTLCVDLCEDANCHRNATCHMNDAKKEANCSCNYGFGGNGTHCFDLCEDANCHSSATCNMDDAKKEASCSCNYGFDGNGTHCFDLCKEANCHQNANCSLQDEKKLASCSCNYGFKGNGTHCVDLCKEANCHEKAKCLLRDDIKFANCSCHEGYRGNGTYCTAYLVWTPWTTCLKLCGEEFYNRSRECVDPEASFCVASETKQKQSCELPACAVHGNWTNWSDWTACSVACGSGIQERTRSCTNPAPEHGGDECEGVDKEIGDCDAGSLCPGEAGFGSWSNWTECNMTCDEGVQTRSRVCENEALGCLTETPNSKPCLLKYCPVNGSYTTWSNWTACSTTCGPGQQLRHRNCTEPKPAYGGADCEGPGNEVKECFIEVICSADFGFALWSPWSACTTTCGDGLHWRARECAISNPGSVFCLGKKNQTEVCNPTSCPIDGVFTNWTSWSECDSECGSGQQNQTRSCTNPPPQHGGEQCSGEKKKLQDCDMPDCPVNEDYSSWSSWSACSVSCEGGVQSKTRHCLKSSGCDGPLSDSKECLHPACPVNGGFTEWSEWSICTVTCGSGIIERTRECSDPRPAHNGSDCFGLTLEIKECTMPATCSDEVGFTVWSLWSVCNVECSTGQTFRTRECQDPTLKTCNGTLKQNNTCYAGPCPIDGGYSGWSPWSPCSGYCGSGLESRSRTCINPEPAFNGAGCSGGSEEIKDCQHSIPCSGESGYEEWSEWTLCTQTCGNSTQIRTRTCKEDAPPEECSAASTQAKPCDKGVCPIHGGWSDWSAWSSCSSSCGSGSKLRDRSCTNPVPSYGGLPCFGISDDYSDCVLPQDCPGEDEFSDWGNWGACNASCGDGTRQRSRYCTVVPSYPPADDPYCTLSTEQYIPCFDEPCIVNGNFTPWTDWSACTTSCGFGTRTRYRNCTNPPPLFGGSDCLGPLHDMKECENAQDCPDDIHFSSWADWAECSSPCEGVTHKTRSCVNSPEDCVSSTKVSIECNTADCPVDGTWSQWTPWALCSKTCGHQEETRTRVCENQRNGGEYCSGHDIEVMPCNEYDYTPCPDPPPAEWSDWSWWTVCTKGCAGGRQERYRLCNNPEPGPGAEFCVGERNQSQECNTHPCPIHGEWSEWATWTDCTLECGNGTHVRARACTNPRAEYGGQDCEGEITELGHCNVDPCPIDGGFTQWTSWTHCNKPCDTGILDRRRTCTNPTPMYGGMNCTGESLEANDCNQQPCSPGDVIVDVSFIDVTWSQYMSDAESFKLSVRNLLTSVYSSFPPAVSFLSCSQGNANEVKCSINLNYQSIADVELVLLQDKLLHPTTRTTLHSITSQNVLSSRLPVRPTSQSSTSIDVEWDALPSGTETSKTSTLSGYIIFYKETTADSYNKIATPASLLTKTLEDLKKFTQYRIVVCPFSEKGNGVPSMPVETTTKEDVPSFPPIITNISSPNSTSLKLNWTRINDLYWHGVPRGYCVTYQARGSSVGETLEISNSSQLSTTINNLKPYTLYYVQVAAKTIGCGVQTRTSCWTLEDAPNGPPQTVSAESTAIKSVGILVKWDEVLPEERNGIIQGFKVIYWTGIEEKDVVDNLNSSTREIEITGLKFLTDYKVEVVAYTNAGDGPASAIVTVTTDESTPAAGPVIVEAFNTSSSKIYLKWEVISENDKRGNLLGYRIFYRPSNTKREDVVIEIPDTAILEYELPDLFWWWWYEIRIAGYTRIGTGVTSNVTVQTDERIPSRFPENIRGNALTTTSMLFEWDPILPGFAHGIILSYNLTVRKTDNLNNVIVEMILPAYERSYYEEGLKKYTNYTIWVSAINSKGQGPVYEPGHINSTGEDGPEFPPEDIVVSTLEHISEISLEWTRIPPEYHNGILRGYYIEYTATVLAGEHIPTEKRVVQSKRVRGNRYSTVVKDLHPGSMYQFKVFGYTSKNGTKSNITSGETCRCPKYLRSNWWVLPPYTNTSNPDSPGGIFFLVTRQVLDDMCGTCLNGHGQTEFCYEEGCDKRRRRRSTSNSYQKNSLQSVSRNIDESVEISFPVQGNRYMTTYAGVFPYISVVDAPGSAYFTVKNVPSTAEVVVNAALACLPLVLLMILFAWMAGIVIWVLERGHNPEHFPDPFTKGVPEGFWWAYVSMTTVGYGDRSPVTIPGRIFAMVWTLMGLVIISIVTGGIVTSISSVLIVQEDKLYGAQVGAIENSAEYSKAVRQNSDVVGYNNMEDIINAMQNKEIAGALLDMYAAATKKDSFAGGDIQLNRLIEYPTGYGFVLSGNMAKAAPLFREALAAKKNTISEIVEQNTESISLDRNEAEEAKEKSSGLFDPTAEAFTSSFKVTISLLVTAIVAGLIWHFGIYRRKIKKSERELEELKDHIPSLGISEFLKSDGRKMLENFTTSLKQQITDLRVRHIRERKSTGLYQAEVMRHKGASIRALSPRSHARVSPEVNAGMDDDERSEVNPRSSSMSIFLDLKGKRSAQVHPMGESLPDNGSTRGSSIELKHLDQH